jgi:cyanophycinase
MKPMRFLLPLLFLLTLTWSAESYSQTKKVESHGPENGTLMIIGGAASDLFYEKFMELAGGPNAPIVVIPTAISGDSLTAEDLNKFKNSFTEKGFKQVTVLHTRNREVANTKSFVEPLMNAAGVWFSGGRQWRHADSYLNTRTHTAFFELLERGGIIAGSSAGATIQGSYLARGDTRKNTIMMGDHQEGLSFITNVAIDQHLFARNRQFDMFEILETRPELLGIGLDEDTGIIVEGDQFTVFGNSYVAIYDGTRWSAERDTTYSLPPGSRDFYLLQEGDRYDILQRALIPQ